MEAFETVAQYSGAMTVFYNPGEKTHFIWEVDALIEETQRLLLGRLVYNCFRISCPC